jgi:methyltransferase (TIGR00027 family)
MVGPAPPPAAQARSAWRVALRRAAHQLYDDPVIFPDPYAVRLLGAAGADALRRTPRGAGRIWSRSLRAFAVARSCVAEQQLAYAVANGVSRYCILGAGLDTFALRNPWPHLAVVEVDYADMQHWKRGLLQDAAIPTPRNWGQQPGDLAHLLPHLATQPTFFSLLGVAPYLHRPTFAAILAHVREHGAGSGIVFDYRLPRELLPVDEQRQHDSLSARLKDSGEPFVAFWSSGEMAVQLSGFSRIEQLGAAQLNERFFARRKDGLSVLGEAARIAIAWV